MLKAQLLSIMVHHDAQQCMLHDDQLALIPELYVLFTLLCKITLLARHTLTRFICTHLRQHSDMHRIMVS